jgi:hypothetical protein
VKHYANLIDLKSHQFIFYGKQSLQIKSRKICGDNLVKHPCVSINKEVQISASTSFIQDSHKSHGHAYNRKRKNSKFYRTNQDPINNLVLKSKHTKMDTDSFNLLKIYHQNICGLKYKTDELISTLESNLPHVICLTEHHLNHNGLNNISHYKLGAQYCREKYSKGGTCIFLHETLEYDTINLKKLSDLDTEACAITIHSVHSKICILYIYRAPSHNFSHFIKKNKYFTILIQTKY